ncbi:MAG: hypothetical protein WBN80_06630 [Prochlorococcaceae cyanobacterium]
MGWLTDEVVWIISCMDDQLAGQSDAWAVSMSVNHCILITPLNDAGANLDQFKHCPGIGHAGSAGRDRLASRPGSSGSIGLHHVEVALTGGFVGVDHEFTARTNPAGIGRILEAEGAVRLMGAGAERPDGIWLNLAAGG